MIPWILVVSVAAQAPDSARTARWEQALAATTDSLDRVRGAAMGFRVDLDNASSDLVLTRAAQLRTSCARADEALRDLERLLEEGVYSPRARDAQARLRGGTAEMRRTLARCQREWQASAPPRAGEADSLKAWGPYRTAQLNAALLRYQGLVRAFMRQAALKRPVAR